MFREEGICTNTTGDIICAWHPKPKFPYELSQPIPRYLFIIIRVIKDNYLRKGHFI